MNEEKKKDTDVTEELKLIRKKPGWTLRRERKKLVLKLKSFEEGTAEYNAIMKSITDIDRVWNEKLRTAAEIGKFVGMTGITVAGLVLSYNFGDRGEQIPNRITSKFTDGLFGFFRR